MEMERIPIDITTAIDIGGIVAGLDAEGPATAKTLRMSRKCGHRVNLDTNTRKGHNEKRNLPVRMGKQMNVGDICITGKEMASTKVA